MAKIIRKENPPKFNSYKKYKKYLRKDFDYSCAYCSIQEGENGSFHNFACEHFKPKSRMEFRHLKNNYENLLYACLDCNQYKANKWPSETLVKNGFFFLNPCEVDYADHFEIDKNFKVIYKSNAARYMIEKIHLNRNRLVILRKMRFFQHEFKEELSESIKTARSIEIKRILENFYKKFCEIDELRYSPFSEKDME